MPKQQREEDKNRCRQSWKSASKLSKVRHLETSNKATFTWKQFVHPFWYVYHKQ